MTLTEIKQALQELNLRPSRRLGQNYLHDQNLAGIIVKTAGIRPGDKTIEIGPGLGSLTEILLKTDADIKVIETDFRAVEYLKKRFPGLNVIAMDALEYDYEKLPQEGWICVGNLPYSIASRLIVKLCLLNARPHRMVFTVQREVAERLVAKPDTKDYGVLTLLTQPFYEIKIVRHLPKTVFYPEPEVESSVVLLEKKQTPLDAATIPLYGKMVKMAFQHRRKTLGAIFSKQLPANLDPKKRPAEILVDEWIRAIGSLP